MKIPSLLFPILMAAAAHGASTVPLVVAGKPTVLNKPQPGSKSLASDILMSARENDGARKNDEPNPRWIGTPRRGVRREKSDGSASHPYQLVSHQLSLHIRMSEPIFAISLHDTRGTNFPNEKILTG
jgi:hypothetical protein